MASIAFKQIYKSYGNISVIKGIDLEIKDGELVVFIGPSGCGKSTMLRLLAGLEEEDSGSMYIGDSLVNSIAPKDRNIAMIFQNYALYPHMTVAENIGFGLKLRGMNKKNRIRAVDETASLLGLEHLLTKQPRQLSGGQRQRVAMGRAIIRNPKVFLMDEPLSNLDAKLRNQMRIEIKKLQRRLKTTTIFVTHDQIEAMTLADRIVVLNDGKVQQVGAPSKLYSSPVNKFVAGFLGSPSINFIHARRTGDNELTLPDGQCVLLPVDQAQILSDLREVEIGIRPEQIDIVKSRQTTMEENTITWSSSVSLIESLGSEKLVYSYHGEHEVAVKTTNSNGAVEGSNIQLSFSMNNAHLFALNDGRCLSPLAGIAQKGSI
jgi:multiple sugar transport system ATP-binding protein